METLRDMVIFVYRYKENVVDLVRKASICFSSICFIRDRFSLCFYKPLADVAMSGGGAEV